MKTFEIKTPDERRLRRMEHSAQALKASLLPGYEIVGEVLGADGFGQGGVVTSHAPGAKTIMGDLLEHHGDELLAWLAARSGG